MAARPTVRGVEDVAHHITLGVRGPAVDRRRVGGPAARRSGRGPRDEPGAGAAGGSRAVCRLHEERRLAELYRRHPRHAILASLPDHRRQLQRSRSGVALQDRQSRLPSGIQARGHAAGGGRHPLHDGRHAALRDRARRRHRRVDLGASLSGRRARRERAPAVVGPRPRVLDRRPPRRAHPLCHARLSPHRPRREDRAAGQDVRQGRRHRSESGRRRRDRAADRSRNRRDRPPLDADDRQGHRPHRLRDEGRDDRPHEQQHQGARARVRRADRPADLELPDDPQARRGGRGYVVEQFMGDKRQHGRVDADHGRRRARPRVPPGGIPFVRLLRWQAAGQQSLRREPRVRRSTDRQAQVVLPVRAPSDLGPRSVVGAAHRGRDGGGAAAQGRRRAEQAGMAVRLRSGDRRADLADRGETGPEGRRAGRVVRADAAASAGVADVRPQLRPLPR